MTGAALPDRVPGSASQYRRSLEDFGAHDYMKFSRADAALLMAEFDTELAKAISRDPAVRDVQKGAVSPAVATMLEAANFGVSNYGDTIGQVVKALQAINPDIAKDITITSPLSTGFVPYDLQAPSKKIFPALSPLRNRIPRTQGQGTASRFKRVTGISGSGTGGVADIRPFISEQPSTSFGSLTLQRPPKIAYAADDQTVTYKFLGLSDSVSFGAEWTARGFESMRALSAFSLMKSMMILEEKAIIGGRITALPTPAANIPTGVPRAAQAGETAVSGYTTNAWFWYTAVGQFGETPISTISAAVAVTNGTSVVDVLVTDKAGALGYKLYVGTGAGAPATSAGFYGGTFASNQFTLQGPLPTTGDTASAHAADSGTNSANDYDGLFAQVDANGGVARRVNNSPTATMFDTDLALVWDSFKADPDELLFHGTDRLNFSNAVINTSGSQNQAYRIALTAGEQGSVLAGAMVTGYLNKVTGKEVRLSVHPWFKQGNAVIASWALPFPWSEVPNTVELRLVQDYLQIDWPVIQMAYDLSILMLGALVIYAPIYFLDYHGIAQTYGAAAGQAKYS